MRVFLVSSCFISQYFQDKKVKKPMRHELEKIHKPYKRKDNG